MDICVAVVTYNAADTIKNCLLSILHQQPHGGCCEVLVVDGCSSDETIAVVQSLGDQVRLIRNPGRTIASNRNVALSRNVYPYIAFTDADCIVPSDWLVSLSTWFTRLSTKDPSLAGVGGGNVIMHRDPVITAAYGAAMQSMLGSLGSIQSSIHQTARPVGSIACLNALYDRDALELVGGFDEKLENICEDADVNYRLVRQGKRLYSIPGAVVEHWCKCELDDWMRKMTAYGEGRARIMRKHRTVFSLSYIFPVIFLPLIIAGTLAGAVWPTALVIWAYVPVMFVIGLFRARSIGFRSGILAGIILIVTHFCYSIGLYRGLLLFKKTQ